MQKPEQINAGMRDEEVPAERDFSVIWTSLPLSEALRESLEREKEKLIEEGEVSHTRARQRAREKIEAELTDEEYESILAGIKSRPPRDLMMPPPIMLDAKEADPVFPLEPD